MILETSYLLSKCLCESQYFLTVETGLQDDTSKRDFSIKTLIKVRQLINGPSPCNIFK